MSDLDQRIAHLSPEKREILLKKLNKQQSASSPQAPIARRSATGQASLSFAQESLWLVDQMAPGNAAYNLSCAMRLVGPLNVDALEQALQEIVKRHESARTTFRVLQGQPTQVIAPSLTIPLEVVDFHHLPESDIEQKAREHLTAEAARPFDLSQGPLLRMTLLRLAKNQHILLLVMHHIISDEWSVEVLMREVTTLYGAFSAGQPSPLPDLPIQYADYALWQRERLQGESMNQLLDYWKRRLEGAPEVLELPADHPRPPVQTFRGASLPFQLPSALNDHLRALSQQEQTSLFMTLLAAFNVLLARYTHNEDVVIGSPITNRSRAETEGLIGYLVNMLVLRADLSGSLSFRELLRQVRKTTLEAYSLQDLPFEKLVEAIQPRRSLSYTPLFQIVFQLENAPPSQLEAGGVRWQWLEIDRCTAKFDLQLSIRESQDELSGLFTYNTDLFEAATIQRMVGHLHTLLEGIVADPDQPITTLPLLTETERQQLLVQKNAKQANYFQSQCIHQNFEAQVARTPDATALIYDGAQLTYRQLNERANRLAHYLRQLGVGPEILVGLCVERSVEMIVGLLGILKAGGAYVPLDPSYPKERLAIMLSDAQVPVLLTQTNLQASLPAYAGKVICLDVDSQTITQASTENLDSGTQPENLAYVIYTSGSTGTPKGVMVTHSNVTRLFAATDEWYHFNERDIWTFFHSYAFDFSVWELWGALLYGGRVVVVPYLVSRSPEEFYKLLVRERVTVLNQTPSAFYQLIDLENAGLARGDLSLRLVIFGGEALEIPKLKPWFDHHGDQQPQLVNMYGITETTVHVTYRPLTVADVNAGSGSVIGYPIPDLYIYVLDQHLQPLPIGIPGEMYVGGDGVARGYLNRPELTDQRFIHDPFNPTQDARLYKTGDLARYLSNGDLEYLGRIDHQVKVRGFRIELGEIEANLRQHPAVRDALVLAREDTPGNKRLVAYVVSEAGEQVNMQTLRPFLKDRLPDYMLPAACVALKIFPLTTNGKIDRKALPAPESSERTGEENYAPPTLIEHYELIGIWEELLNIRPIRIRDNFFDLGGHSLLAAQLINRIELVFSKKIPLAAFYAEPTIERLAHLLEQQEMSQEMPVVPVQAGGSRRPFFYLHGDLIGGAWYCFPLARHLGPEQPFYSIQPYQFDGRQIPPTFEAMAADHLQSLQAIQPEGPYLLGGFCFGGLLAYEMARQLQAQGQQVDLLALINPTSPAPFFDKLLRRVVSLLGKLPGLGEKKAFLTFLWARHFYKYVRFSDYRRAANKAEQKSGTASSAFAYLRAIFPRAIALGQGWGAMNSWVLSAYQPGFYRGKVTFFWAEEEVAESQKWRKAVATAKATELQVIPGSHLGCLREHLPVLAEELDKRIRQVQGVEGSVSL